MTAFSWLLEFIAGIVVLAVIIVPQSRVDFIVFTIIMDAFLNFIIIPSSYILNTEVLKSTIIAEGWGKLIRHHMCPHKITPSQNEAKVNARDVNNPPHIPISTVSCDIHSLASPQPNLNYSHQDEIIKVKKITANK